MPHELQTAGVTHLHIAAFPEVGGDTYWASSYDSYDKISQPLQEFIEGKYVTHRSMHEYIVRDYPLSRTGPVV